MTRYDQHVAAGLLRRDVAEAKANETSSNGGKTCSKCGVFKPVDGYWNSPTSMDRLVSWCKDCYREYNRSHHARRVEQQRQRRARLKVVH